MNEADTHPNRPRVTLIEHAKRVDYCSEQFPNRTVIDPELVANTTKQKRYISFIPCLSGSWFQPPLYCFLYYVFHERIPYFALS